MQPIGKLIELLLLALAKVPYATWLRFVMPLFLILGVVVTVFLVVAVATGYR